MTRGRRIARILGDHLTNATACSNRRGKDREEEVPRQQERALPQTLPKPRPLIGPLPKKRKADAVFPASKGMVAPKGMASLALFLAVLLCIARAQEPPRRDSVAEVGQGVAVGTGVEVGTGEGESGGPAPEGGAEAQGQLGGGATGQSGADAGPPGVCEGTGTFVGSGDFEGEGSFSSDAGTFDGMGVFAGGGATFTGDLRGGSGGLLARVKLSSPWIRGGATWGCHSVRCHGREVGGRSAVIADRRGRESRHGKLKRLCRDDAGEERWIIVADGFQACTPRVGMPATGAMLERAFIARSQKAFSSRR